MNVSHTDLTNLTEASRFALATIRMKTLDEVDKLRALFAMQPFREIREICVKPKSA